MITVFITKVLFQYFDMVSILSFISISKQVWRDQSHFHNLWRDFLESQSELQSMLVKKSLQITQNDQMWPFFYQKVTF